MSGWEVCRKIRQDAALAHTGVLMLTGIGENLNEATSPLFGADEYIDKPFEFEQLDAKVLRGARRGELPSAKQFPALLPTRRRHRPAGGGKRVGGSAKAEGARKPEGARGCPRPSRQYRNNGRGGGQSSPPNEERKEDHGC